METLAQAHEIWRFNIWSLPLIFILALFWVFFRLIYVSGQASVLNSVVTHPLALQRLTEHFLNYHIYLLTYLWIDFKDRKLKYTTWLWLFEKKCTHKLESFENTDGWIFNLTLFYLCWQVFSIVWILISILKCVSFCHCCPLSDTFSFFVGKYRLWN